MTGFTFTIKKNNFPIQWCNNITIKYKKERTKDEQMFSLVVGDMFS